MKAIYKREVRSYFNTMMGYVLSAFLLVVTGLYFTSVNLQQGYPDFGYVLANLLIIVIIAVPILTMRVMAEEKRQKTDQLLLTSPARVDEIVAGKFFAIMTVYAVPIVIFCLFPLVLSRYGQVNFLSNYVCILGFYLLSGACISIGMFISSLTDSQVVSAAATFGVLLMFYLMSGIISLFTDTALVSFIGFAVLILILAAVYYLFAKNFYVAAGFAAFFEIALTAVYMIKPSLLSGRFTMMLKSVAMFDRYYNFVDNILDIPTIIYYLSVTFFFLFLTYQAIQKKRWN